MQAPILPTTFAEVYVEKLVASFSSQHRIKALASPFSDRYGHFSVSGGVPAPVYLRSLKLDLLLMRVCTMTS